jgi:hypothetical protein
VPGLVAGVVHEVSLLAVRLARRGREAWGLARTRSWDAPEVMIKPLIRWFEPHLRSSCAGSACLWPLGDLPLTAWLGAEEGEDGEHPAVLVGRLG